jgi:hypothetical protein
VKEKRNSHLCSRFEKERMFLKRFERQGEREKETPLKTAKK